MTLNNRFCRRSDDEFDENSVEAQQASIDRSPRVPENMRRGLSDIMASGEAGNGDAKVTFYATVEYFEHVSYWVRDTSCSADMVVSI